MGGVTCPSGKQRHASQGQATAHLRGLRDRRLAIGLTYDGHVYPCLECAGWHIGRAKKGAHRNKYADQK